MWLNKGSFQWIFNENIQSIPKRAGYAAKNYEDKRGAKKVSVKTKRLKCGWDNHYLLKILTHAPGYL